MKTLTHKTFIMGLLLMATAALLPSCNSDEVAPQVADSGLAVAPQVSGTRAESGSTVASDDKLNEASLEGGLQVLLFNQSGQRLQYWHLSGAEQNVESLLRAGNWMQELGLTADQEYDVYVVANAGSSQNAVEACESVAELEALTHTDADICNVHSATNKKYFLMTQRLEWTPTADTRQVIQANALERAAAKLRLDIHVDVEGHTAGQPSFRLVNYNEKTTVLEKDDSNREVSVIEMKDYVGLSADTAVPEDGPEWQSFVTYSYPFSWTGDLNQRPSVLVRIPLTRNGETTAKNYYYRIPLRPASETDIERNHIYVVKANITSLGASSELTYDTPVDLQYTVLPWADGEETNINIPDRKYIMVTPELVLMKNESVNREISFIASSKCAVEIQEVYYYDKDGNKKTIASDDAQYPTSVRLTGETSGDVVVESPIPTNLKVKYIKLCIYMESDRDTYHRDVTVKQYPIEYAHFIEGKYSSRTDEANDTIKYWGSTQVRTWVRGTKNGTQWTWSGYNIGDYRDGYEAKVYDGGRIKYFSKNNGVISVDNYNSSGLTNNRMYVIQITSTNGDYVIGQPNIDYRDENSASYGSKDKVVSPAFMIASQLGAVYSSGFTEKTAITHCKTYREVGTDGTVYDGWRLPTNEEVKVIIKYQKDSNSPIDPVLTGEKYRTLSQSTEETGYTDRDAQGTFVRCVRDMTKGEIEKLEKE